MSSLSKLICLILVSVALASGVAAQEAAVSEGASGELAVLKAELERLSERVEELERQLAEEKESAAATPASTGPEATASAEEPEAPETKLEAGPDGFVMGSEDGAYKLRVGGQFGFDHTTFKQNRALKRALGDDQDGTGFRFIRLRLSGTLGKPIGYMFELDFAGDQGDEIPTLKDMFIDYRGIPFIRDRQLEIRVGHFREPFGFEEWGSTSETIFLERSLANVFSPARNPGILARTRALGETGAERMTFGLGLFKQADDWPGRGDSDEDRGYQVTARVTGLPWYRDEGRRLLHVGLAQSFRDPDGASLRYGVRSESRLSLFRYIDTDNLPEGFRLRDGRADRIHLTGLELAGVYGPFSMQGEYHRADIDAWAGDIAVDGYYVQAAYTFTGEVRPYDHRDGTLDGITPARYFGFRPEDGWGAWEGAVRWSEVDLNDNWLRGGEHQALSLGLNWYLNPNTRIMLNWTRNFIDHPRYDGEFDAYQTRFQLNF